MNRHAINTSRFILASIVSEKHRQGYVYELFHVAEHARSVRDFGLLETAINGLSKFRLTDDEQETTNYFKGYLCLVTGSPDQAKRLLEGSADRGNLRVRVRALSSLGALSLHTGDLVSAGELYNESYLIACRIRAKGWAEWLTYAEKCILRGFMGDHRNAARLLEEGLPAARVIGLHHPGVYLNYLNSLAVEYTELGRIEEASRIMRPVAHSPLLKNFAAWQDTLMQIRHSQRRASRSKVAIPNVTNNDRILDYCEYVKRRAVGVNDSSPHLDLRLQLIERLLDNFPVTLDLLNTIHKVANHDDKPHPMLKRLLDTI